MDRESHPRDQNGTRRQDRSRKGTYSFSPLSSRLNAPTSLRLHSQLTSFFAERHRDTQTNPTDLPNCYRKDTWPDVPHAGDGSCDGGTTTAGCESACWCRTCEIGVLWCGFCGARADLKEVLDVIHYSCVYEYNIVVYVLLRFSLILHERHG